MTDDPATVAEFERLRPALTGLAYRMLGSLSEAEDVVQNAFLRWRAADQAQVRQPRAFLYQVVTRLCLDELKSARARRESYVGTWLPEPVLDQAGLAPDRSGAELAQDLSFALLLTLERLTPNERAAFILHDVFELEFREVGEALGQSEVACRQLAARARTHLREPRARFQPSAEARGQLMGTFLAAVATGDVEALRRLLAEDAVYYADAGGRFSAALKPIRGADRIARFFAGVRVKFPLPEGAFPRLALINGMPGVVIETDAQVLQTFACEIDAGGRVAAIYTTRNPDKLRHVSAATLSPI